VEIKAKARELGFSLCRILPVERAPHGEFFAAWLRRGNAADMHYLARQAEERLEPGRLVGDGGSTFRSLIVLGTDYFQGALDPAIVNDPSRGLIAAFAWGGDYHEILKPRLYDLDAFVRTLSGRTTFGRCFVDTGPVLERDWAQRAGLGFTGKNCCVINPSLGSWLFLATMLVPEALEADAPIDAEADAAGADGAWTPAAILDGVPARAHFGAWTVADDAGAEDTGTCGRCDRCLVACPTDAFVGPFHLDARRCISYWTIETQAAIPRALRARFGNRIFGCDICQEVCPWNRGRAALADAIAGRVAPPLLEGFASDTPYWLEEEAFHARFRRTPVTRAKRAGMLRNVCVALGNWGSPDAVDALGLALRDASPIARGHAAWALGRIASPVRQGAGARLANRDDRDIGGGNGRGIGDGSGGDFGGRRGRGGGFDPGRIATTAAIVLLTEALRVETDVEARLEMRDALARAGTGTT